MPAMTNMMTSVLRVTTAPHDPSPVGPAEIKAAPVRRESSAFSSTLRSVQRTHGASNLGQRACVSQSRRDRTTDESQKPTVRPEGERRFSDGKDGKVRSRSAGSTVDARHEVGKSKEADTETPIPDGTGTPLTRVHSETTLRDQLEVSSKEETANVEGEAVLSFESEETPEVFDAGVPAGLTSGMAMVGLSTAASPESPAQLLPASGGTEDRREGEIGMEGPVAQPSDSDVEGVSQSNHQARRLVLSEESSNDLMPTEPHDSMSLTGKPEEKPFAEPSRSHAVVTKGDGPLAQGHGEDHGRPLDQTMPSPSHLSEMRYRDEKFALAEERRRAEQPTESGDRTSDLGRFKYDVDHVQEETPPIQKSNAPSGGDQELIAHRFEMTVSSGSAPQSNSGNSGDPQRQADPMPKPQRSSVHGSDADGLGPVLSRSVTFEVSRHDLGHVNIRVAVRNDLVHAHLSSDRLDVAQYLAAGHDRLQSALQANGLEMGQFRVDVDRHGGGRSFHHGPSHDQDRTWQPERPAPDQRSMMPESRTYTGIPYAGMLNVVA